MEYSVWLWLSFSAFVIALLVLDLRVFHRKAHAVSLKEGAIWTGVWITLALALNLVLFLWRGAGPGLEFLTGYVIEKALSVDNIFLFVVIFSYFRVEDQYQHRVLFWGILGALVMRAVLILLGTTLLTRFHWLIYLFGAFLLFTGIRMGLKGGPTKVRPEHNPIVRLFRRVLPVTEDYHGKRFFIRQAGQWYATPLFIVLLVIESTDLLFALDSIPAILAITRDPFIVYTSNVFAILGLRALYFVVDEVVDRLHYLPLGLAAVLAFAGIRMLLEDFYRIPILVSLAVIVGTLTLSIVASLLHGQPPRPKQRTQVSSARWAEEHITERPEMR
jgi:tellurite resistance protein TerC